MKEYQVCQCRKYVCLVADVGLLLHQFAFFLCVLLYDPVQEGRKVQNLMVYRV